MKDILTAEDEKYLTQHEHSGMTREDVVMLKLLAANLEHEGRIREQIANLESMLERGGSWGTIEALTGIDEAGMHNLRESWTGCRAPTIARLIDRSHGSRTINCSATPPRVW